MIQAFIGFPGPTELMIIVVIILVLFGGAKLPEMARNIGRGMRVFKEEANTLRKEIEISDKPEAESATPSASKASDTTTDVKDATPEAKAEKDKSDLEKMAE
jgi:sec-independent protein translocase protein TatA